MGQGASTQKPKGKSPVPKQAGTVAPSAPSTDTTATTVRNTQLPKLENKCREIQRQQIQIEKEIGRGFYGVVSRGIWETSPGQTLQVAVKEMRKCTAEGKAAFLAEAVILSNLSHPRLVKLHGVVSTEEPFLIVTEYVKDGSLLRFLREKAQKSRPLLEVQLVAISCQVAEGMRYLEEQKVIHRDLAARNVLIAELVENQGKDSEQYDVKIGDFGLAHMIKSGTELKETRALSFPTKWMAPEVLTGLTFSSASDMWSYGILLYEIFTHGKEPYEGLTTAQTRKLVLEDRNLLQRPPAMPERIYNKVFQSCFGFNPRSRPSFKNVHSFLKNFAKK